MPEPEDVVQLLLRALSSPVRREILWMLGEDERPAGEIAAALHVTAPTVSQHLQVLRDAGLVDMRVDGTFRRYRARRGALDAVQRGLLAESRRWTPVTDTVPERVVSGAGHAANVEVEVDCARERVFAGFTDGELYSRWLGAPVQIEDGRFAAALEWGTQVRGRYELVVEPELIAMVWDFDDEVPVPGAEHRAYARFTDTPAGGCHVRVDQLVDDAEQAAFMQRAWGFVLGRLAEGIDVLRAAGPTREVDGPRRRADARQED
jgi:DNA-binding transcriptional ArsR family regulator